MSAPSMPSQLSLVVLGQYSEIELQKFQRRESADPQYGYELFRRALTSSARTEQEAAWTMIDWQYKPILNRWAVKHQLFRLIDETGEHFATMALAKFWLYFTTGSGKFCCFPDLPRILGFLQICVNNAIIDAYHAQLRYVEVDTSEHTGGSDRATVDATGDATVWRTVEQEELWRAIYQEAQTELETLWIHAYCELLLPRRKIVELFPQFETVGKVKQVMDTFLRRVRRNERLTKFLALYHWDQ